MLNNKRENWVDTMKAICMVCVYIAHCSTFYWQENRFELLFVTPFYVNGFFFVSGYLLFKKYANSLNKFSLKEYINANRNLLFKIVIPTIFFSSLIYLPKNAWFFNWKEFTFDILGGTSFWFTSALCISQLVLYTLFLTLKKNIWCYLLSTSIIFVLTTYFGDIRSKAAEEYFPWFWQTGLIYTPIMILGGLYCIHNHIIDKYLKKLIPILLCSYLLIIFAVTKGANMFCFGLSGKTNPLGILSMLLGIYIIICIAKRLKFNNTFSFIGKQSIVFYFLSGAIPKTILALIRMAATKDSYLILTIYVILSLAASYLIAYIITKYLPFVLDLRKLPFIKRRSNEDTI